MKILITDKAYWLEKVEIKISQIEIERERQISEVKQSKAAYDKSFWKFLSPEDYGFPCQYARSYGITAQNELNRIRAGLKSENTSDIYLTGQEMEMIT